MTEIIAVLAPVLRWLIMKKDSELPWVVRLSRWVLALCGSLLQGMVLMNRYTFIQIVLALK